MNYNNYQNHKFVNNYNITKSNNCFVQNNEEIEKDNTEELSNLKSVIYYQLSFHTLIAILAIPCFLAFILSFVAIMINGLTTIPTLTAFVSISIIGLTIYTGLNLRIKYRRLNEIEIVANNVDNDISIEETEIIEIPESQNTVIDINPKIFSLISKIKLDKQTKTQIQNEYNYGNKTIRYNSFEQPYLMKTR